MGTNADNQTAIQDFLNRLAILSPRSRAIDALQPQPLELAVAQFCAYEVYRLEALGLLDSYQCTSVSVWATLEEQGYLAGSTTIAGTVAGTPRNFKTPTFHWQPVDAQGHIIKLNYEAA